MKVRPYGCGVDCRETVGGSEVRPYGGWGTNGRRYVPAVGGFVGNGRGTGVGRYAPTVDVEIEWEREGCT